MTSGQEMERSILTTLDPAWGNFTSSETFYCIPKSTLIIQPSSNQHVAISTSASIH